MVTSHMARNPKPARAPQQPALTLIEAPPAVPAPVPHQLGEQFANADFVDRVWDYLLQQWPQRLQDIPADEVEDVKQLIRQGERGERPYITPAGATQRERRAMQILALFNGRNASEVARVVGVGRATVYRVLKQQGKA